MSEPKLSLVYSVTTLPEKVLPPLLGIMLTLRPPPSASAVAPLVSMAISSTIIWLKMLRWALATLYAELVFMPSTVVKPSPVPWWAIWVTVSPCEPPMSPAPRLVTSAPRVSAMKEEYVRAVGTVSNTSRVRRFCVLTLWTSTTGVAPVTVTVSWTAPTDSPTLTVAVNPAFNSIPSRTNVAS